MAVPLYFHILTFLAIAVDIYIIYGILRKREQASIRMNWLMILSISTVVIWIISVYLEEVFFPFFPDYNLSNIIPFTFLAYLSNLAVGIGLLFLFMFFNLLTKPNLDFKKTTFLISVLVTIGALYVVVLIAAFQKDIEMYDTSFAITNLFNLILLTSILYFINQEINVLKENIEFSTDQLKKQLNLLHWGLITILIGLISTVVVSNFINRDFLAFTFFIITLSLSLIAYGYQIDPRIAYILPDRVYQAIIVNSSGVLKYHINFQTGEDDDDNTVLISGALNAVISLMSEFYDSPVHPSMIEFEKELILFDWEEDYFLATFVDRESRLISEAMKATMREIKNKYGDNLENVMMKEAKILDLDDLFAETFYFAYPIE